MIELAIVGAGSMGRNHGRVAMGLRDARVAVIVDPDEESGKALATASGAEYAPSIEALGTTVDAAVVCVPTEQHARVGTALMRRGLHVLVEKPISRSVEDARSLVDAADEHGVVLMVGHVERFNPAVAELVRIVEHPVHIEAHRISPYTPRIRDGVVLDLMVHDLDIARAVAGGAVVGLDAFSTAVKSASEDLAVAMLRFDNGVTATLTASRMGQQKIRRLTVTETDSQIQVNLMTQTLTIHRVGQLEVGEPGGGFRQTATVESPFLPPSGEPLYRELAHFVECIIEGTTPITSGRDGLAAVTLATDIIASAGGGLTRRRPASFSG